MKRKPKPPGYASRVLDSAESALASGTIRRGQVAHAIVAHDDWCDLLANRGPCNCHPDVRVQADPPTHRATHESN